MRTHRVVLVDILPNELPQIFRRLVFRDVKAIAFQAAEPALNHNVVCPAGLAIHALPNAEIRKKLLVIIAGKLASLV